MTNKITKEEIIELLKNSPFKGKLFEAQCGFWADRILELFDQLLITTIEGIGFEEKKIPAIDDFNDNPNKVISLKNTGYNEYHRKLEAQKQEKIKGLKQ